MRLYNDIPLVVFDRATKVSDDSPDGDCDCDCAGGDCACSSPSFSNYKYSEMGTSLRYLTSPDSSLIHVDEKYIVRYGPYHKPVILNSVSESIRSAFSSPKTLIDVSDKFIDCNLSNSLLLTLNSLVESRLIINENEKLEILENQDLLTAWLHVTDRCNLKCDYCYLPHLREDMSMSVGQSSIDALLRSAKANDFSRVKIKYAGGESLIRFDFIQELHLYAIKAANQFGIQLNGSILSNGTLLTSSIAQRIKQLKLSLMISLDGLGAVHDTQRKFAGGQGSFESVQTGIQTALREGLSPHISITVSGKNAHGLPELIQWILENGLTFSINFYRENELAISKEELNLDEGKIISGILSAYKMIEKNLPRRSLLSGLVDRANLSSAHSHTCGVGRNYMVFDWKGMVSKCQMQMKKPVATMHDTDPLKLIQLDRTGIQNLPVDQKSECNKCEWKHWCTGGCSLLTHSVTGRYDLKSPNCKIYKAIYPEAMRLEGLRLLKYAEVLND